MQNQDSIKQGGFSIIEVLIVMAVLAILVTFAVAQFGKSSTNLERQNIAREFKVALERARFDSVKRRPSNCADMARVEITSATSFKLYTDMDRNDVINDAVEFSTVDFTNRSTTSI